MKKKLLLSLICGALLVPATAMAQYCTIDGSTTEAQERWLTSFTLSGDQVVGNSVIMSIPTSALKKGHTIYFDLTDSKCEVTAGVDAEISILPTGTGLGQWIHGYLYVDWDNDETFADENPTTGYEPFNVGATGIPAAGSELVSYSYFGPNDGYNGQTVTTGYDSKGTESIENNTDTKRGCGIDEAGQMPSFTIPATTPAGTYRARFVVTWNSIDPCALKYPAKEPNGGNNDIASVGGNMVDFTLQVGSEAAIDEVEAGKLALYYNDGAIYTTAEGEIAIYNITGKLVKKAYAAPVDVDDLANGVYIVKAGGKAVKFVK